MMITWKRREQSVHLVMRHELLAERHHEIFPASRTYLMSAIDGCRTRMYLQIFAGTQLQHEEQPSPSL